MMDLVEKSQLDSKIGTSAKYPLNEDEFPGDEEDPIFQAQKVQFNPSHEILQIVTANNLLVISFSNSHIIRIKLQDEKELEGTTKSIQKYDFLSLFFQNDKTFIL
jgi:hypothetical protein